MNPLPPIPSPDGSKKARASYWRLAFALYALALTTATHWPRLQLPQESPASDKTIHVITFAGFTFLLWRTAWIGRVWMIALIALAWAAIDESTQSIPVLHRHASWTDYVANALGILLAISAIIVIALVRNRRHR